MVEKSALSRAMLVAAIRCFHLLVVCTKPIKQLENVKTHQHWRNQHFKYGHKTLRMMLKSAVLDSNLDWGHTVWVVCIFYSKKETCDETCYLLNLNEKATKWLCKKGACLTFKALITTAADEFFNFLKNFQRKYYFYFMWIMHHNPSLYLYGLSERSNFVNYTGKPWPPGHWSCIAFSPAIQLFQFSINICESILMSLY